MYVWVRFSKYISVCVCMYILSKTLSVYVCDRRVFEALCVCVLSPTGRLAVMCLWSWTWALSLTTILSRSAVCSMRRCRMASSPTTSRPHRALTSAGWERVSTHTHTHIHTRRKQSHTFSVLPSDHLTPPPIAAASDVMSGRSYALEKTAPQA